MLKKTQLVQFDRPNNCDSVDVEKDGFVLQKKSVFKMLGLSFTLKLNLGSYVASTAKKRTCFTALSDLGPLPLTCSRPTVAVSRVAVSITRYCKQIYANSFLSRAAIF